MSSKLSYIRLILRVIRRGEMGKNLFTKRSAIRIQKSFSRVDSQSWGNKGGVSSPDMVFS